MLLAVLLLSACGGKTFDIGETADGATSDSASSDSASSDTALNMTRCTGPNTCSLVPTTCCGTCSQPTTENMTAVTKGLEGEHSKRLCGPEPMGCPACAPLITDKSVQAWCVAEKCTAIDVKKLPLSSCSTDGDCQLRYSSCCEPCEENPYDLVALNHTQTEAYRKNVCSGDETCSRCLAVYPADTSAVCDPVTKHCRVKSPYAP